MQTLRVTINLILYLKCYLVKYTNFSSIVNLATFSFHCAVKSHVYHVKYTDLI